VTVGVTSIAVEAAVEVPVDVGRDLLTVTVVAVAIARQVQIANARVVHLHAGAIAARTKGITVAALVADTVSGIEELEAEAVTAVSTGSPVGTIAVEALVERSK